MKRRLLGLFVMLALVPATMFAQGVQTGTLTGTVKSTDGVSIPDAAVVVTSPALQGERAVVTDVNGIYSIPSLPPGTYTIRVREGRPHAGRADARCFRSAPPHRSTRCLPSPRLRNGARRRRHAAGGHRDADEREHHRDEVNVLPMGRTPFLIAELMPGLTTNTPSPNQLTISGGFAYDNVFLIDGVDVNDNLLGTVNDLYIEDAIGEVQVLTSGISAEYGRFSGGVVNIITKNGSNRFGRQLSHDVHAPLVDEGNAVRDAANNIERGKPTAANPFLNNKLSHFTEFTARRPGGEGSRLVLRRGSVRELVDLRDHAGDGRALHENQRQQALRRQADGHVCASATRCRAPSSTTACIAPTNRCCRSASTGRR